jgi:hypothetical protein
MINFLTGITGVSAGNNAVLNMPVNARFHRIELDCTALNYSQGIGTLCGGAAVNYTTAVACTKISSTSGAGLTIKPTLTNGNITGINAIGAGGTGWAVGDTFTISADPTGAGAIMVVSAETAGAVTAATVNLGGTPTPVSPSSLLSGVKQLVNGVNMRDITPTNMLGLCYSNGYVPQLGKLPILYTEPWGNVLMQDDQLSWDVIGQSTFQLQFGITPYCVNPGLSGVAEFDFNRNVRPGTTPSGQKTNVLFLQPVSQHQFSWPIVAGRNDINQLPYMFPIRRLWLVGSTPGNLYQVEVYQDGNKILEATQSQIAEMYAQYGFTFGQLPTAGTGQYSPTATTIPNGAVAANSFDAAFISDPDNRFFRALKIQGSFVLRVYSTIAQTLTIVEECLPGQYAS